MNKVATVHIAMMSLIVTLVPLIVFDELPTAAGALTPIPPIAIEGDSELAGHPALRSGSGTTADPYLFSDYIIDTRTTKGAAISVRNTTKAYLFRNVTIYTTSSATAINISALYSGAWQPIHGTLRNVTVSGPGQHLYLYVPSYFNVMECRFINPQSSGTVINSYYGLDNSFVNNTFDAPGSTFYSKYTYRSFFRRNTGELGKYHNYYWRYCDLSNNTLDIGSVELVTGYSSDLQGNVLTSNSPSSDLVRLTDCNRIKVSNNTLNGGKNGLYIEHPNSYSPVYTNYPSSASISIADNTFNSSDTGLFFFWGGAGHSSISYFKIRDNTFIDNVNYAIDLPSSGGSGAKTTLIYRNRFIHNNGAGDTFSPATIQARDYHFSFDWDTSEYGNHWSDWSSPDENSDGMTDTGAYSLVGIYNPKDNAPVTNPYFDFQRPDFELLRPKGAYVSGSYVNFTWFANDNGSGIDRVLVREGFSDWTEVRDRDHQPILISTGQHRFQFKAIDKANLTRSFETLLSLNRTRSPVTMVQPTDGAYIPSTNIDVGWELDPYFVPADLRISMDGSPEVQKDPFSGFPVSLYEGAHTLELEFHDHYGNEIVELVEFICDVTPPTLTMLYPADGSVISNPLVHFKWNSTDPSGILSTTVSIDGGPPVFTSDDAMSKPLTTGPHTFTVEVSDRAGILTRRQIGFSIAQNTSLSITSPLLDRPTRTMSHTVAWEYLSDLDIEELSITINNGASIPVPKGSTYHPVTLTRQGKNTIKVEAHDPVGNTFSDQVEVFVDMVDPEPRFTQLDDPLLVNSTLLLLKWGAIENMGIDHYEIVLDGSPFGGAMLVNETLIYLSEGTHLIELTAFDRAGNSGTASLTVTVDLTPPSLSLLEPGPPLMTASPIMISWEGADVNGLEGYILNVTNDQWTKEFEMGLSTRREVSLPEGRTVLVLRGTDKAGNYRTIKSEVTIDLSPPSISFLPHLEGYTNRSDLIPQWSEAYDAVGLANLTFYLDGVPYPYATDITSHPDPLDEGVHDLRITVFDIAGRSYTDVSTIIVDWTSPGLDPAGGAAITAEGATISWTLGEEDTSGWLWSMTLDGEVVQAFRDPSLREFTLRDLAPGDHIVRLSATDRAGNERTVSWEFTIESGDEGDGKRSLLGPGILIALLVMTIIAVAAIAAFVLLRRPKRKEMTPTGPSRPERLRISAVAHTVQAPAVAPRSHSPARAAHEKDSAYLRPERKDKGPKRPPIVPIDTRAAHSGPPKADRTIVHSAATAAQERDTDRPDDEIPIWDDEEEVKWDDLQEWEDA